MIPYGEALDLLLGGLTPLCAERVGLDQALGRVLAEDIVAPGPQPAFSYSAMDGYALSAAPPPDQGPWSLPVRGTSRAGDVPDLLPSGSAWRIFTGAPLPQGADAVVAQEDVQVHEGGILVRERPAAGQHVRARGVDLAAGAVALVRGSRLTAGRVGLAARLDRPYLRVTRQPVLTILGTGDELRLPGEPGGPGSIAESNGFVLAALGRQAGAVVRVAPAVADDLAQTRLAIGRAIGGSDVVATVGGASVGDRDLVRPALAELGVLLDFWRVAIKPGKPTAAGRIQGTRILCLPGNPASAAVTFVLFAMPLLRSLQGDREPLPRRAAMRVLGCYRRQPERTEREQYLGARLELRGDELCARLLPSQASGATTWFAEAEALAVLGADRPAVEEGERLPVMRVGDA
ncbi:MAG: molybdopterin molybdotransferase MoeA [Deltaproteobacteria bacterium]|nr:molybdopterin molybdotransferase MoeA [Deltaproteobacteria bacterium]